MRRKKKDGKKCFGFFESVTVQNGNYIRKTKCKRFYEVIPKFRLTLDFFFEKLIIPLISVSFPKKEAKKTSIELRIPEIREFLILSRIRKNLEHFSFGKVLCNFPRPPKSEAIRIRISNAQLS